MDEVQKLKKSDASKEQCTIDQHGEIHRLRDELKRYKQAEQEGRLVVLPCKVGDTVYIIVDSVDLPYVRQEKVIAIELWNKNGATTIFTRTPYGRFEFGKTVFLSKEAAEKVRDIYINKVAEDYGIIKIKPWDGKFYFERGEEG